MGTKAGASNVLQKLRASVEQGNYYEAQQMYKTLSFRYNNQKKYSAARELLFQGACDMNYKEDKQNLSQETLAPLLTLCSLFPNTTNSSTPKETFIKAALKWSCAAGGGEGDPQLHSLLAQSQRERRDFGKAQYHFLRGNKPLEFAAMLAEWCQGYGVSLAIHGGSASPGERDLIICRYLCLSNLADANAVFERFLELCPSLPQTPLINFTRFLLLTVERDAYPLFETLRQRYQPSTDRDPSFNQYLDHIAHVFFGKKPASGGNFLADFMKSFLSMEQEGEELEPMIDDELD